jgi:DNA-binding NarL/FixJ family response regulator
MGNPNGTIRVLMAGSHPAARRGIRAILEKAPDIQVVGEAESDVDAKQMVADLCPDVLLLDLVMPGLRPFKVEEWVRTNYPEIITLVLTGHDRDYYLARMIEAGGAGLLTKEEAPRRLVDAIHYAARGNVPVAGGQLTRANRWHEEVSEQWECLTEREKEVLLLVARFRTNVEIAKGLCVSDKTVERHLHNILGKLGVNSRRDAARWVWDIGLLEL